MGNTKNGYGANGNGLENKSPKQHNHKLGDLSAVKTKISQQEYRKLKTVYNQQRKIVHHNMHKAMSPISAISGYLDLMRMFLEQDVDKDKFNKYLTKIEEGMAELNEIVEELYDAFDEWEDKEK